MNRSIDRGDLAQAMEIAESVQNSIRQADTKATALAGFQLTAVAIALSSTEHLNQVEDAGATYRILAGVLGTTWSVGLAASLGLLGAALWPRLGATPGNRFAFPALAALTEPPPSAPARETAEAWRLAMQLSKTATDKFRLIRLALWAMIPTAASIVAWLCLIATSQ